MRLFIVFLLSIIILGAGVFFSMPAFKEMRRSKAIEKEIEELRDEAERIGSDNNFLREQIEYLKSDHYKERLAKDKLNLKNPGEQVVVVQPGGKSADTSEDRRESENFEEESYKEEISNFKKWLRYFFN